MDVTAGNVFKFSRPVVCAGSFLVYIVHVSGSYSEQYNACRVNWFIRIILAILERNTMCMKDIMNVPSIFNFIFQ
jgi:hypothetical protein